MDVFAIMLVIALAAGWGAQKKRGRDGATWFFLAFIGACAVAFMAFVVNVSPTPAGMAEPEGFREIVFGMFLVPYAALVAVVIWSLPDRRHVGTGEAA